MSTAHKNADFSEKTIDFSMLCVLPWQNFSVYKMLLTYLFKDKRVQTSKGCRLEGKHTYSITIII